MREKRLKFERLAEKRVTDALKLMRLIGNLSNRHNYEYSDAHARQIIEALENELRILKSRFKEGALQDEVAFSFKDIRSEEGQP